MWWRSKAVLGFLLPGVMFVCLVTGCGGEPEPTAPVSVPPPADTGARVTICLLEVEEPVEVERTVQGEAPTASLALGQLLRGPTPEEEERGIATAIPAGTALNSFSVEQGVAKADFSKEMASFGGGSALVQAIITQVGRTVTANEPSVTSVLITVDGVPAEQALQP